MATAVGILGDMILGEPPVDPHPLSVFGRWMRAVEGRAYGDTRGAGALHAALGTATGMAAGAALGSTAFGTYLSVAPRGLWDAATSVGEALKARELDVARDRLPSLVGRNPSAMDEKEVARAVVESVAENTVDALVAPALWATVGGAPGALAYRAVNTLDATVGHRTARYNRYGWASARLDDAANYVPARVTALLVMAVRPMAAPSVWRAVRLHAPAHPSPNAGIAEAAFAGALGLRLGGTNRYGDRIEVRPSLGFGRPAEVHDIAPAVALSRSVTLALAGVLASLAVLA
ncbi:MAG: adenosylcobinamide-phosphate synthase CbiB [Acidimicrobiales bacterium]